MTDFKTHFGEIIRELRLERNITLRILSQRSNVALGYLSEIERGHKEASSSVMNAIASGLRVPLHQIVIETGYRLGEWDLSGIEDSQVLREAKMSVGVATLSLGKEKESELV